MGNSRIRFACTTVIILKLQKLFSLLLYLPCRVQSSLVFLVTEQYYDDFNTIPYGIMFYTWYLLILILVPVSNRFSSFCDSHSTTYSTARDNGYTTYLVYSEAFWQIQISLHNRETDFVPGEVGSFVPSRIKAGRSIA